MREDNVVTMVTFEPDKRMTDNLIRTYHTISKKEPPQHFWGMVSSQLAALFFLMMAALKNEEKVRSIVESILTEALARYARTKANVEAGATGKAPNGKPDNDTAGSGADRTGDNPA